MRFSEICEIVAGLSGRRKAALNDLMHANKIWPHRQEAEAPGGFWALLRSGEHGKAAAWLVEIGCQDEADLIWQG